MQRTLDRQALLFLASKTPIIVSVRNSYSGKRQKERYAELERVTGIEPAFSAWEADVLPLNYTRITYCRVGSEV